jgi:hypothetical protein
MTPDASDWCYSTRELGGRQCPNPEAFDFVHAALSDFCSGSIFYMGADIRRLDWKTERDDIWEIKTRPPDAVRIFGWFYNHNVFIVSHCEFKANLETNPLYQPHKQRVINLRQQLSLKYAPGFVRKNDAKEYFNIARRL